MPEISAPFGTATARATRTGDRFLIGSTCPVGMKGHACREGWLYVALVGGRWKVGYTRRGLAHRTMTLQKNHREPVDLAIGFQVECGIGAEIELIRRYRDRHVDREFFAFTHADLVAIAALTQLNGSPIVRVYLKSSLISLVEPTSLESQS